MIGGYVDPRSMCVMAKRHVSTLNHYKTHNLSHFWSILKWIELDMNGMDLGSKGQTPRVGARLKALDEAVLMAASDFSCNFFSILTSWLEQCVHYRNINLDKRGGVAFFFRTGISVPKVAAKTKDHFMAVFCVSSDRKDNLRLLVRKVSAKACTYKYLIKDAGR